jgi:hypothetical protein
MGAVPPDKNGLKVVPLHKPQLWHHKRHRGSCSNEGLSNPPTLSCNSILSGRFSFVQTQSRQSAKLFLQSSELGLPHPLTHRGSLVQGGGGGYTLACGRGGAQFRRGDRHCDTLGTNCIHFVVHFKSLSLILSLSFSYVKKIVCLLSPLYFLSIFFFLYFRGPRFLRS